MRPRVHKNAPGTSRRDKSRRTENGNPVFESTNVRRAYGFVFGHGVRIVDRPDRTDSRRNPVIFIGTGETSRGNRSLLRNPQGPRLLILLNFFRRVGKGAFRIRRSRTFGKRRFRHGAPLYQAAPVRQYLMSELRDRHPKMRSVPRDVRGHARRRANLWRRLVLRD